MRAIDGRPVDLLDADRAQMLVLPPAPPVIDSVTAVRLGRDYYVRVAGNDYSVDPILASSYTFDFFSYQQASLVYFLLFGLLWSNFTISFPEATTTRALAHRAASG